MKNLDFKKIGIVVAVILVVVLIGYFGKKHMDKMKAEKAAKAGNGATPKVGATTQTTAGRTSIMTDSPFVGGAAIEFQSAN